MILTNKNRNIKVSFKLRELLLNKFTTKITKTLETLHTYHPVSTPKIIKKTLTGYTLETYIYFIIFAVTLNIFEKLKFVETINSIEPNRDSLHLQLLVLIQVPSTSTMRDILRDLRDLRQYLHGCYTRSSSCYNP